MASSSSNAQHGSSNQDAERQRQQEEAVDRIMGISEDHYQEILEIPLTDQTPQPKEVTDAYRKMALLVHPDRCRDDKLKGRYSEAFKRLENACTTMKGDINVGSWFHPSAYVSGNDDGPDPSRPQEENPPSPDDFIKRIYDKATPDILNLMKDPTNKEFKAEIVKHNTEIMKHNEDSNKPKGDWEDNVIKLNALSIHYEKYADLLKEPSTQKSRIKLQDLKDALKQINTRFEYPSMWIPEAPPDWSEDTENPSQPGEGKPAADQAKGQGAAAASSDPDSKIKAPPESPQDTENSSQPGKGNADQAKGQGAAAASSDPDPELKGFRTAAAPFDPDPDFKGVRTRDNEPILGYRKVGRDGRQYLVQMDGPENPAYEFRSQAGDDGVGRRVGRAYEESKGAVLLGEVDKKFTKNDAHRYVGIKGVAYKPIQVQWDGSRERYPVTSGWAIFKNPPEEHWVYRTTIRRVAGKRDADLDIRDWSESHGLVPSQRAPPRNYIIKNDAYDSDFPRRARTGTKAADEEDVRTRLDKLENTQKEFTEELAQMKSEQNSKFDTMMAILKDLQARPSPS